MATTLTVYKVLIASPRDVVDEREAIKEMIDFWNSSNSSAMRMMFLAEMWEKSSVPEMGDSPQKILNRQFVDDCDLLIGVFWSRIGTPTDESESGTVEEIERFVKAKKPVALFFSKKQLPNLDDIEPEQIRRLKNFKNFCDEHGIYKQFESNEDLKPKIFQYLTQIAHDLREKQEEISPEIAESRELDIHQPDEKPGKIKVSMSEKEVRIQEPVDTKELDYKKMPKTVRKIFTDIIDDFAEKVAQFSLFDAKYAVYIYSLHSDPFKDTYALRLESFGKTYHFSKENDLPLPNKNGKMLKISYDRYQSFVFGIGGGINRCGTIYSDLIDAGGKDIHSITIKPEYWKDNILYYCGYRLENLPLVIFIVFDVNEGNNIKEREYSAKIEKSIQTLPYLDTIIKILNHARDKYHKKQIYDEESLIVYKNKIDRSMFPALHESLNDLSIHYRYDSIRRLYYDFIIKNSNAFKGQLTTFQREKLLLLSREFEENQRNIFRIDRYRDHLLHQSNVYILGSAVICLLNRETELDIVKDFNLSYSPLRSQAYSNMEELGSAWFLTSMFHNICYPIENFEKWINLLLNEKFFPQKFYKPILEARLYSTEFLFNLYYGKIIEKLADYHRKLNFEKSLIDYIGIGDEQSFTDVSGIKNLILNQITKFRDHGILSALMLLERFIDDFGLFRFLFPAAAAISIHNFLWIDKEIFDPPCKTCVDIRCEFCRKWSQSFDQYFEEWDKMNEERLSRIRIRDLRFIQYKKDPLAFLLILCNLIQDWGRYYFEHSTNGHSPFINPTKLVGIRTENRKIVFDVKVNSLPDSDKRKRRKSYFQYKKQQIAEIFSRLRFVEGYDIVIRLFEPKKTPIEFSMNYYQ